MEDILNSKGFSQCKTCERIFRPWHMGTVYEPTEDGKHKYAKGVCRYCQSVDNHTIRDYTDEEINTIQDIIEIKRGENIILNSLKDKNTKSKFGRSPLRR